MSLRISSIVLLVLGILTGGLQAEQVRFSITSDGHPTDFDGFDVTLNAMSQVPGGVGTFMVSPGDMEHVDTAHAMITAEFGAGYGWYPVVGNHDHPLDYLINYNYGAQGNGPVNPGPAAWQNTIYSFDAGPVHIVALNVYGDGSDIHYGYGELLPAHLDWLESDLAATDKDWILVFGHEQAYPHEDEDWGESHTWMDSGLNQYPESRDLFWQMLEDHDVTAYIHGHTHLFSHHLPVGGRVWEIDTALSCEPTVGMPPDHNKATFLIVEADEDQLVFEVWRDLSGDGVFAVTDLFAARGDVNEDGFVGGDDLTEILTNWGLSGMTRQDGDLNNDGFIGGDDYTEVLTYWGTGTQPVLTGVPEPATLALLVLGGLAMLRRRPQSRGIQAKTRNIA